MGQRNSGSSVNSASAATVVGVLRKAISGKLSLIRLTPTSWDEAYCGFIQFNIGGWLVTFYNDCDSLDYCDRAVRPEGGEYGTIDYWWLENGLDPVGLLSEAEQEALEKIIKLI